MARRSFPRPLRIGLWSFAGLIGVLIVAVTVIAISFDPNSLKPRVEAAVKQATGRDLTLLGNISLGLSLQPTLVVQGVSLANPPGFSRPEMVTLHELDLKLALLPLLSNRIEIDHLILVKPDILLETDAQGRPNWLFTPPPRPAETGQPAAAGASRDREANRLSIADVRIEQGTLTWRDGRTGTTDVLGLTSLRASAASPEADMRLAAAVTHNGVIVSLAGETGPLTRLQEPNSTAPWPVRLQFDAAGAKLAVNGTITQPLQGRGYTVKLTANIPDLTALAPLLRGQKLPPLRDVNLSAQIADSGGPLPQVSDLALHVGASDLTSLVAGLKLDKVDVSLARLDQPAQVSGQGIFGGAPATLAGSIGAPAALLPGGKAPEPLPLDLSLRALGSSMTVKGTVATGAGGRPVVQAQVAADKLDVDALRAALPKPAAAAPAAAPSAAPAARPSNGRVIPDTPIPFDLLHQLDAVLKLNVAQLTLDRVPYRAIAANIDLHNGKLWVDPLSADLPEGHVDGSLTADASLSAPAVAVRLRMPALGLQPLLAAMGEPRVIDGKLNVQADLRGVGATPHAIAASLDGSLSATMANGTIDNRLLGSLLGSVLREVNLLDLVGRGGTSEVRCFVVRLDASHGVATIRSLALVSSLLTIDGEGSVNLGAETLDLRLRPQGRVAGTSLIVPLRVSGPMRSPATAPDPAATITQNAGTVAGVLGGATPLGLIAGALGGKEQPGGAAGECAAPRPAAVPGQAQQQQQQKLPNVGGILKQLLR